MKSVENKADINFLVVFVKDMLSDMGVPVDSVDFTFRPDIEACILEIYFAPILSKNETYYRRALSFEKYASAIKMGTIKDLYLSVCKDVKDEYGNYLVGVLKKEGFLDENTTSLR